MWNHGGVELGEVRVGVGSKVVEVGAVEEVYGVSVLLATVRAFPLVVGGEVEVPWRRSLQVPRDWALRSVILSLASCLAMVRW